MAESSSLRDSRWDCISRFLPPAGRFLPPRPISGGKNIVAGEEEGEEGMKREDGKGDMGRGSRPRPPASPSALQIAETSPPLAARPSVHPSPPKASGGARDTHKEGCGESLHIRLSTASGSASSVLELREEGRAGGHSWARGGQGGELGAGKVNLQPLSSPQTCSTPETCSVLRPFSSCPPCGGVTSCLKHPGSALPEKGISGALAEHLPQPSGGDAWPHCPQHRPQKPLQWGLTAACVAGSLPGARVKSLKQAWQRCVGSMGTVW